MTEEPQDNILNNTFSKLLRCQQKIAYSISQELKQFNITRQQYEVLKILNEYSGSFTNLSHIKNSMRENVPDISRIVQRLVEKKLINRKKHSADKRNTAITINNNGIQLLNEIEPTVNQKMKQLFNALDKSELEKLSILIGKVNKQS